MLHFKASSETAAFKSYYEDTRMLGKHFRVTWTGNDLVSRHYTVCNVMNPATYQEYVNALKKGASLSSKVFNSDDRDFQILTAKNYNRPEGLSTKFFSQIQDNRYQLTGPIGLGLCPTTTGVNVAFAGGTGVLTFMDFVAHIAR